MLPENTSFSLQGHSRPGDLNPTHTAKPKQAMVIRLTTEALEALEAMPPLEIEFGENPRIYIGDKEYPMLPKKEVCPHDLYLRTYTASKPLAPLRLHANVTGKFQVQASLEKALENIRAGTAHAKASRGPGIVSMKDPPASTPGAGPSNPPAKQKKRNPTMFKKPQPQPSYIKVPEHSNLPTPSTSTSPAPPKPSPAPPKPVDPGVKSRLIKCLARSPRPIGIEQIFRLFSDTDRAMITQALKEVAEQKDKLWTLTNESWLQARPYEWDKCTDVERHTMAQHAKAAAAALGKSESDPIWNHFKPRSPTPTIVSNPPQSAQKRPSPLAKEVKEKEKKPPAQAAVKSESSRASPLPKDPAKPAAPRRPGSGYQVRRSTSVDVASPNIPSAPGVPAARPIDNHHSGSAGSSNAANRRPNPTPTPASSGSRPAPPKEGSFGRKQPISTMKDQLPSQSTPKAPAPRIPKVKEEEEEEEEGEVDSEEDRKTKRSRPYSPAPAIAPPPRHIDHPPDRDIKRPKGQAMSPPNRHRTGGRDESRDRGDRPISPNNRRADDKRSREDRGHRIQKMRDTAKAERNFKVKSEESEPRREPIPKRKVIDRDDRIDGHAAATKKRRTEGQPVVTQRERERDLSLPSKPVPQKSSDVPKQRPPKETSAPVPKIKKEHEPHTPRVAPTPLPANSPAQSTPQRARKRASPNYTSSEEDGEAKPLANISKGLSRPPLPNLNDRKALRARYERTYSDYIMAYAQVSQQRNLLQSLEGGSGSDVDIDDEVMEFDALERLQKRHDMLRNELETIRDAMGAER